MRVRRWNVLLGLAAVLAACAVAQQKGGEDETGPYEVVANWPQPLYSDGWSWGSIAGIWAESPVRVFVYGRGELQAAKGMPGTNALPTRPPATGGKPRWQNCLMVFDRNGKFLFELGKPGKGPGEFDLVHSIAIDADQQRVTSRTVPTRASR